MSQRQQVRRGLGNPGAGSITGAKHQTPVPRASARGRVSAGTTGKTGLPVPHRSERDTDAADHRPSA